MNATLKTSLLALSEKWRGSATSIEVKYPANMNVEVKNVSAAFEQCAEELEDFICRALETQNPS